MKFFKTYEDQARSSVILAAIGGLCAAVAAEEVLRRFEIDQFWIPYNPESMLSPGLAGMLVCALLASTVGFYAGFNSAGQRRNQKSRLSWTGFFLNAGVIALALSTGVFFFLARNAAYVAPKAGG